MSPTEKPLDSMLVLGIVNVNGLPMLRDRWLGMFLRFLKMLPEYVGLVHVTPP